MFDMRLLKACQFVITLILDSKATVKKATGSTTQINKTEVIVPVV